MSNSTVTLYLQKTTAFYSTPPFKLNITSNEIIEDLEEYLDDRADKYVFNEFMYLKIRLDLDIKIDFDQSYSHSLHKRPINYVKIEEDDETFYYFVSDFEWISESGVRLKLHLDVLNTYQIGRDYDFGSGTIVHRQHFDRWKNQSGSTIKTTDTLERVINIYPEEMTPPVYKTSEAVIYDDNLSDDIKDATFTLVFQNQDDPSQAVSTPVNIFLVPDVKLKVESSVAEYYIPFISSTGDYDSFYFVPALIAANVPNVTSLTEFRAMIVIHSPSYPCDSTPRLYYGYSDTGSWIEDSNVRNFYAEYGSDPQSFIILVLQTGGSGITYEIYGGCLDDSERIPFTDFGVHSAEFLRIMTGRSNIYSSYEMTYYDLEGGNHRVSFPGSWDSLISKYGEMLSTGNELICRSFSYGDLGLNKISDLDRTNTRYIKMLSLPYSLATFVKINDDLLAMPEGWGPGNIYEDNSSATSTVIRRALKPVSNYDSFTRNITAKQMTSDLNPIDFLIWSFSSTDQNALRVTNYYSLGENTTADYNAMFLESKLYNSSFAYIKICYDSFSYIFKFEQVEDAISVFAEEYDADLGYTPFSFKYRVTASATFAVLNVFDQYEKNYQTEDYDNVMIINRNNEIPLYSSDYLTYLNTGYNYDVKAKNLSVAQQSVSILTNAFDPGKLANPLSMASGVVKGITSTIFSELQAENNLSKTLTDKQYQTESINGADDLDLLYDYTDHNKYKLELYEPIDRFEYLLTKYFILCGYACNTYGSPDLSSRTSFNYAEVDPDFEWIRYISKEMIDELEAKWRGGVFVVHHNYYVNDYRNPSSVKDWDDGLDTMNIELSLTGL